MSPEPLINYHLAVEQLKADLRRNAPVLRVAVALALKKMHGIEVDPHAFSLTIHALDEDDFQSESNISALFGLSEEEKHKVVENGLLAVGGLNQIIESMQTHTALTGLQSLELPVFDCKLSFIEQQMDPERQQQRFRRILKITGFPDLSTVQPHSVDLEKVLDIRNSDECRSFRTWIRASDDLSDAEIEAQFRAIREKLARVVHSRSGRMTRWAVSTGVGLVPGAGTVVGAAMGLLDSFLMEKIIPKPGPVSFLGRLYPSIFK